MRRFWIRLRPHAPAIAIATVALVIAIAFVVAVLRHNHGRFGLPLDDSYIYLTYAKQFGRAEPFTYYSGGGYSAGATSVLWPMLLAPLWTLGARGHALVSVSFGLCTVLYAATAIGCFRIAREIAGRVVGGLAALLTLAIAPLAFASLAGMEVALATALLIGVLVLLAKQPHTGPPSRALAVALAGLSLSRPEATLIVLLIIKVAAIQRLRRRAWRDAAWWVSPIVPMLIWLTANKLLAGHWFPNTGVVKSHFYQPGFDWSYWWTTVLDLTKQAFEGLVAGDASPFTWPPVFAALWIVGAGRIVWWGARHDRRLLSIAIVAAPLILVMAVIGTSGAVAFQGYRYIAPAFPLFAVTAACALAPIHVPRWPRAAPWVQRGVVALFGVGYAAASLSAMQAATAVYAQNATDLERQVVTIGQHVHDKLPGSSLILHDAGAIAYYGDTPVFDMLGLVTNGQASVANHGPGARFEFLERLPPAQRPTHFAYYPNWMGQYEFFGEVVLETRTANRAFARGMVGSADMQLIEASWDHVHSAERPLIEHPGWHVADRLDIADLDDEDAHGWTGDLGRRQYGDPTAKWSVFHHEVSPVLGLLTDGGRTIRGRHEHFTMEIDPAKPVKLILRSGGNRDYDFNEPITQPAKLSITTSSTVEVLTPIPQDKLVDIEIDLPHADTPPARHDIEIDVTANRLYRVFHWFALQPD